MFKEMAFLWVIEHIVLRIISLNGSLIKINILKKNMKEMKGRRKEGREGGKEGGRRDRRKEERKEGRKKERKEGKSMD
jgi:hypothetical protein